MTYRNMKSMGEVNIPNDDISKCVSISEGFKKVHDKVEPFRDAECTYGTEMRVNLTRETKGLLRNFDSSDFDQVQQDPKLKKLMNCGTAPKCDIREVQALHHPARWYSMLFLFFHFFFSFFLFSFCF
eukprot:Phypoly_transcript_13747.p1 GENE.Phypoly_transcript_13747~~Phypoly_transcript_13747.p1  ORF type:complete len:142 (+),score=15.98 Phypoly_transcript_13747:48-428(+)